MPCIFALYVPFHVLIYAVYSYHISCVCSLFLVVLGGIRKTLLTQRSCDIQVYRRIVYWEEFVFFEGHVVAFGGPLVVVCVAACVSG